MKVLLLCPLPFSITHGGAQIQVEQTWKALDEVGIDVEPLRWWDDKQTADIIHYFGRVPATTLFMAQKKGIRFVIADLLTAHGSRPLWRLNAQGAFVRMARRLLPRQVIRNYNWDSYRDADACVALTGWEAKLMQRLFGAPADRVHVVPNGVEAAFLESQPTTRGPWLVCTATVTERKRVLELAEAAVLGQTPVWIVGKPYSERDPYSQRFLDLAKQNPRWVRYEGPISDRQQMARVYREARGFVLLSTMESLSLSALEATACECPLLLSDLPWATTTFGTQAMYCPIGGIQQTAGVLRRFHDAAPTLKAPDKPLSWREVALQLKELYERLLRKD